jgi:hypothetical protein
MTQDELRKLHAANGSGSRAEIREAPISHGNAQR